MRKSTRRKPDHYEYTNRFRKEFWAMVFTRFVMVCFAFAMFISLSHKAAAVAPPCLYVPPSMYLCEPYMDGWRPKVNCSNSKGDSFTAFISEAT